MLKMECPSPDFKFIIPEEPVFEVYKSLPEGIGKQLEAGVVDFIKSSGTPESIDKNGFYYQTLQALAAASVLNQGGELWLGVHQNELWTYVLAHIDNGFDGRLAYTVTQAWVREDQRGKPWVRWAWAKIRQRAKDSLCKHFVVLSTKENTKAYCRFLGKGFKKYCEILKEEI